MRRIESKILTALILALSLGFTACDSWMTGDHFFDTIADEVKYANAEQISVYVRYPNRNMGETSPNGKSTQKVDIPFTVTAVDANAYGFYKWAAFPTSEYGTMQQYNILFDTEELYEENYGGKELGEDEVVFDDPRSPVATAKVLHERNDVFIMPICVRRPYIQLSNPVNGATGVVKNSSITLSFSRPMDPTCLITENLDEDGNEILDADGNVTYTFNTDFVSIQPYTQTFTSTIYDDINDSLRRGGVQYKMIAELLPGNQVFKLTLPEADPPFYLPNRTILITISGEVKDELGYTMADDALISFQAGTELDEVKPKVLELDVGTKTLRKNNSDDNQIPRVGTTLNVRAYLGDKSKATDTTFTDNVTIVNYKLERIQDPYSTLNKNGSVLYYGYGSQGYAAMGNLTSSPRAELLSSQNSGITFPVSLSGLSDGLYKLIIWGTDTAGNVGDYSAPVLSTGADEAESKYIYFIKDTASPSDDNKNRIEAVTTSAPYGWYNASSISSIGLRQKAADHIVDEPNYNNVFRSSKVWWNFYMGSASNTWGSSMTADDESWSEVPATGVKPLTELLGVTSIDTSTLSEGSVNLYAMFKDDIGNMSSVVLLENLVNLDVTNPAVGTMTWISPDGVPNGYTANATVVNQRLAIPFTESLSGVKKIEITVDPPSGSTELSYEDAFSSPDFAVQYKSSSGYYYDIAKAAESGDDECILDSPWTSSTSDTYLNTLYLSNLKIVDDDPDLEEGNYTLHVKLYDAALNVSAEKTITICVDNVAPSVQRLSVVQAVKFESPEESDPDVTVDPPKYFLTKEAYDSSNTANKVTLDIDIKELGAIYEVTIGGNASLTSQSKVLTPSGTEVTAAYSIDVNTNTIRFTNRTTAPYGDPYNFKISNVLLDSRTDTSTGDQITVNATDYAMQSPLTSYSTLKFTGDAAPYDCIYMDYCYNSGSFAPESISLKSDDAFDWNIANDPTVDVSMTLTSYTIYQAGVDKIKFTGAKAVAGTTVKLGTDATGTTLGYTIEDGGYTVKFDYPLVGTGIYLYFCDMELASPTQGNSNTVTARVHFLTGWEDSSLKASTSYYYDDVNPVIGTMSWVSQGSDTAGIANSAVVDGQYLVIPVTETTTGVLRMKIEVRKEGDTELSAEESCANVSHVGYSNATGTSSSGGTALSSSTGWYYGYAITPTPVPNTINISYPLDYGKAKYYYISGLKISDDDPMDEGNYEVSVTLYDYAGNASDTKTIDISNDHTKPDAKDTWFEGVENTALNGSGTYKHPHHRTYTNSSTGNILYVKLAENGSGIKNINLDHYTGYDPYRECSRYR